VGFRCLRTFFLFLFLVYISCHKVLMTHYLKVLLSPLANFGGAILILCLKAILFLKHQLTFACHSLAFNAELHLAESELC